MDLQNMYLVLKNMYLVGKLIELLSLVIAAVARANHLRTSTVLKSSLDKVVPKYWKHVTSSSSRRSW
ncbi:hypothetical protein DPMN_029283 [Dreissena polymorpha]|uniref:Uncharacterized protein n=1 Tax=Dreissena polymorpha TaxID=45954 RepID=A0A9D4LYF5_DREPO|nr:hypothetical protein DPMN_029283 [Dreissena polymorpha]